ncbi:MAG: sugar phosphate nucleotidyltransferase [Fidelibacterota bacterium]
MRAIILAAGVSRRLYPVTETTPKCLLDIGGKTIIERQLASLKLQGISEITIVLGYYREKIKDFISVNFPDLNIEYIINHHFFETNTAHSVYLCRNSLICDDHILMNGDVLYPTQLLEQVISDPYDTVLAVEVKKCGMEEVKVIEGTENRVVAIGKKLVPENCLGEFIGVAKFSKEFNQAFGSSLEQLINAGGKEDYFEAAIELILNKNHVYFTDVSNYPCLEIDFAEDLINARAIAEKDKDDLF